jgi:hypothetical protein
VASGRTAVPRQGYPGNNHYYGNNNNNNNNNHYYGNNYYGNGHYHGGGHSYYGHPYYYPYYPSYYAPYAYYPPYYGYAPGFNLSFFWGTPGFYGAYSVGWGCCGGSVGYVSPGYAPPYGYSYSGYGGQPYGGVRIDVPQRDAQVFVDGYLVGKVDNFDGKLQQANVETGAHHIEVVKIGFEPVSFDVNVEAGRTITYRGTLMPAGN